MARIAKLDNFADGVTTERVSFAKWLVNIRVVKK